MNDLPARTAAALAERQQNQLLRRRRVVTRSADGRIEVDGRSLLDAASNDYLGLSHHPEVIAAAVRGPAEYGAGSGASALVSGYSPAHRSAERAIAEWKSVPAAVLLGSGYAANSAAVSTLAAVADSGGVRFLFDKLVHASLVDAVRAATMGGNASFRVFPHNHLGKLRRLLESASPGQMQVVLTESIFSMDGDAADLPGLVALKEEFGFTLLLDEAHGSGVFGPCGDGYAAELGLRHAVDVTVVTLSKALGVAGGAVCASADFIEAMVNFARTYVYSTNIPPATAAAVTAAVAVMRREPARRVRLAQLTHQVRTELARRGVPVAPGIAPIVPILFGDPSRCLAAAAALAERGIYTVAIRPPTVPPGSSRLRITLSSVMTDADVTHLIESLEAVAR